MTRAKAGAVVDGSDLPRYKLALLASPSRSWARPSGAFLSGVLAVAALVPGALACGDPIKLIFDADAGSDASVAGTGGLPGIAGGAGSGGLGGSGGVAGNAGSSGAGAGGAAGSGGASLLDASVPPVDAGADAAADASR